MSPESRAARAGNWELKTENRELSPELLSPGSILGSHGVTGIVFSGGN